MSVDIKAIRWLLDNATAYAISMTSYAHTLQEKQ